MGEEKVPFGEGGEVEGECIEGYTSLAIVVYLDETFEPEDCAACNADDLLGMGGSYKFCAYRVEVPCEPMTDRLRHPILLRASLPPVPLTCLLMVHLLRHPVALPPVLPICLPMAHLLRHLVARPTCLPMVHLFPHPVARLPCLPMVHRLCHPTVQAWPPVLLPRLPLSRRPILHR